jgi:hypothetical protein
MNVVIARFLVLINASYDLAPFAPPGKRVQTHSCQLRPREVNRTYKLPFSYGVTISPSNIASDIGYTIRNNSGNHRLRTDESYISSSRASCFGGLKDVVGPHPTLLSLLFWQLCC